MSDDVPTVRAIPLRARQRHRIRAKKSASPPEPEIEGEAEAKVELPALPVASFDPGAEDFFRAGDSLAPSSASATSSTEGPPASVEDEGPVEPARAEAPPKDLARRRRLARVVSWAVGFATLLCVAALARSGLAVAKSAPPTHGASTSSPAPSPEPTAAAEPAPTVAIESPPPEAAEAAVVREEARALLAKRALADAIVAAKRAVELDPSDAESWLILGAAQIDARRGADAVETFRSCVRLATTGPVGECRAFVR
jgi:hypothetical protein